MNHQLDGMLPGGINEGNSAFDVPNSEGKEMKCKYRKPKTVAVYCGSCSHHVIVTARADENFSQARVETCGSCSGTGQRCEKCEAERKARQPKTEAA